MGIHGNTCSQSQFKHMLIVFHQGTPNTRKQQKPQGFAPRFYYFLVFRTPDRTLKLMFELLTLLKKNSQSLCKFYIYTAKAFAKICRSTCSQTRNEEFDDIQSKPSYVINFILNICYCFKDCNWLSFLHYPRHCWTKRKWYQGNLQSRKR